ncbi:hypothetical protein [Gimesia maris]|uniref:hypothetical protein n=1 Tax=Gimesia maris TaxID=122 RepID=UPI003A901FFA
MKETTFEPALIEATQSLPGCLSTCLSVSHFINSKWQDWKHFSYDPDANSLSMNSEIECDLEHFKNAVELYAPGIISTINKHLHLFAEISDVVDLSISPDKSKDIIEAQQAEIDYVEPQNIFGTSAHHAGILVLEAALRFNFWLPDLVENCCYYPPSLNMDWLLSKLHWERMRLFKTNDQINQSGNLSSLGMLLSPEEPESQDVEFHTSTQGITQDYHDKNGQLPPPLKGNKTELCHAVLGGVSKRPGKRFADMVRRRNIYVVKVSAKKFDLYLPQNMHASLPECRKRLSEYDNRTAAN